MQFPSELLLCMILLVLARGLPIPAESNMTSFGVFALAYERWGLSPSKASEGHGSTAGYSPANRPQIWGGTPANTSICRNPALWNGKTWWAMLTVTILMVAVNGVLAFVMWGIMSVDLSKLTVWNRTGRPQRRVLAGKVLKVRNRPHWLLLSLVFVSVGTAEVLPVFWSHLFVAGSKGSLAMTNSVILLSQVAPAFIIPTFHLQVSGRSTWFIRLVMWLTAPAIVLPAYALRKIGDWRKRGQHAHMDGILSLEELAEYIHLHEEGEGYGGTLPNHVGMEIRNLLLEGENHGEASSRRVEREGSWSNHLSGSIASTSIHSLHLEGSTTIDTESTIEPTSMRLHRQEGSTAIENIPAPPGLKKRGERSTESHQSIVPVISMQIPQQALIKDPIYGSSTTVTNRCVELCDLNGLPLRQDFPSRILAVTPCKHWPIMESYWGDKKTRGLFTDSFLLERTK